MKLNGLIGIVCAMFVLVAAPLAHAAEKGKIVISASADLIEMQEKIRLLGEAVGLMRELRKAQGFEVPSAKVPKKVTKPARIRSPFRITPSVRVRIINS